MEELDLETGEGGLMKVLGGIRRGILPVFVAVALVTAVVLAGGPAGAGACAFSLGRLAVRHIAAIARITRAR